MALRLPPKRAVWEDEFGPQGAFDPKNSLSLLALLAEQLNTFIGIEDDYLDADDQVRELSAAWALAAGIISEQNLARATEAFNRAAATVPFRLKVDEGADRIRLVKGRGGNAALRRSGRRYPIPRIVGPGGPHAEVVRYLWEWFGHPEWRRLKRCPECEKWFVDTTRPRNAQRCGNICTWRWNNRSRAAQALRRGSRGQRRGGARKPSPAAC